MRVVLMFATLGVSTALACSCDFSFDEVDKNFSSAVHVFVADVVEVDEIRSRKVDDDGHLREIVRIRARVNVTRTFKGDTSNVVFVVSDPGPSACGLSMIDGDEYIFFTDEIFGAGLCRGSLSKRAAPDYRTNWYDYQSRVAKISKAPPNNSPH